MTGPRNWDKELADIDRVIAQGGAAPPAGGPPVRVASGGPPPTGGARPAPAPVRKRDLVGVWFKVLLAAAGAAALAAWPYRKSCGTGLYLYLALLTVIAVAALWAGYASWRHRRGAAHVIALLVLLGALVLTALQILPRIGYAAHALTWTCHLPVS